MKLIMDRYAGIVYTIIFNQLRGFSREDVEECVSDTFLDLYNQQDSIDLNKGSIKTFLCVIAKRKAINFYHANIVRYKANVEDSFNESEMLYSTGKLEDEYIKYESRKELINKIQKLGKPDNDIIIRKFYFMQNSKEIASDLGLTENAVNLRVFRALKKLKNLLEVYKNG